MRRPEWSPDAVDGLRRLVAYVASTPRGKPAMRAKEVLAAVAELPRTWPQHPVRRRVGAVALRRLTTDHGSVVVFSHEDDPADPAGFVIVRWVAHGNALDQEPPPWAVRPAEETPRARPPGLRA